MSPRGMKFSQKHWADQDKNLDHHLERAGQMTEEGLAAVPPPTQPHEVPSPDDWQNYFRRLGASLPPDYQHFIQRYGTAGFDEFIWVFNPKSASTYFNLIDQAQRLSSADREMRDAVGRSDFSMRVFPELGGLLPFGNTSNGDVLYWRTGGDPDEWPICVRGSRDLEWEEFAMNMTGFLDGILSGRVRCSVFPGDFPSDRPTLDLPAYLRATS